jgi:hypothetical protein
VSKAYSRPVVRIDAPSADPLPVLAQIHHHLATLGIDQQGQQLRVSSW